MSLPDYIVIRRGAGLPESFHLGDLEGRWFDLRDPRAWALEWVGEAVAVPTGRCEVRDDGAVAEVYEVRP